MFRHSFFLSASARIVHRLSPFLIWLFISPSCSHTQVRKAAVRAEMEARVVERLGPVPDVGPTSATNADSTPSRVSAHTSHADSTPSHINPAAGACNSLLTSFVRDTRPYGCRKSFLVCASQRKIL
jgi:hypothetical protein